MAFVSQACTSLMEQPFSVLSLRCSETISNLSIMPSDLSSDWWCGPKRRSLWRGRSASWPSTQFSAPTQITLSAASTNKFPGELFHLQHAFDAVLSIGSYPNNTACAPVGSKQQAFAMCCAEKRTGIGRGAHVGNPTESAACSLKKRTRPENWTRSMKTQSKNC